MRKTAFFFLGSIAIMTLTAIACDDDIVPLRPFPPEAGADASGGDGNVPAGDITQTGQIVILQQEGTGVAGATITIAGQTLTSDSKGNYSVSYAPNTPVSMTVDAPNFYKILEGEWTVAGNVDRGTTRLLSDDTAAQLLPALALFNTPYDATLGVISVWIIPKPPCTTDGNATIDISPKTSTTSITYFNSTGFPSSTVHSTVAGQNPHAAFYNVPVNTDLTFTVSHPTCGLLSYPQADDAGFTYTGKVQTQPAGGQVVTFFRLFMGAQTAVDAGTDASDAGASDAGDDASD